MPLRAPLKLLLSALLTAGAALALDGQTQNAAGPAASGDPDAGAEVYRNVCKECHGSSLAPPLRGVVGRHIASAADFDYTDALLAKKEMVWTPENLDVFLTDPQDFAPGTEMKKKDLTAQDRANVIAYLASLSAPKNP